MVSVKKLDVCIAGVKVGTLAVTDNYLCAFEYSDEWIFNKSFFTAIRKESIYS